MRAAGGGHAALNQGTGRGVPPAKETRMDDTTWPGIGTG